MNDCLLLSFQRHLQVQGRSVQTQESYLSVIRQWMATVSCAASDLNEERAYAFLVTPAAGPRSASWFNGRYYAVVSWLTMRGLPVDLRGLRPQSVPIQPPRWFSQEEVRTLLAAVPQRPYRMLFQMMLGTGMRVSEAAQLHVCDIDPDHPLIRVRCGKGGDGRLVPLSATLRDRLRAYWRTFRPRDLFFVRSGAGPERPLLPATLNAALQRGARKAGIPGSVSSHRLRHTFAIESLHRGMDIVTLQKILGHRCIQSTLRYLTPNLHESTGPVDLLAELEVLA